MNQNLKTLKILLSVRKIHLKRIEDAQRDLKIANAEIGEELRIARVEKHLQQQTVAKRSGLRPSSISSIESGDTPLDDERLAKILAALDISV